MRKSISVLFFMVAFVSLRIPCNAEAIAGLSIGTDRILATGRLSASEMAASLVSANPDIDPNFAQEFAALYIREGAVEGVNHDVAFSQMCLETEFLRFGGLVNMDSNNFGGIGVISAANRGERFASILLGVRAQIQHLKSYATAALPVQKLVDPRYHNVRHGSVQSVYDLSGKWSVDLAYGQKLKNTMDSIYVMVLEKGKSGASAIS
jgi:hypothetical protein